MGGSSGDEGEGEDPTPDHAQWNRAQQEMYERIMLHFEEDSLRNITDRASLKKIIINKQIIQEIERANQVLPQLIRDNTDITTINRYLYAAATSIMEEAGIKIKPNRLPPKKDHKPKWERKMENQIERLRCDISVLSEYARNNIISHRARNQLNQTLRREKINNQNEASQKAARKKLELSALSKRLAREKWNQKEKHQNKLMREDPTKLFRELKGDQIKIQNPPDKEQLETFWRNIFERDITHNNEAQWIQEIEEDPAIRACEEMPELRITLGSLKKKIAKSNSWKAPGPDKVPNFWLKQLTAIHLPLMKSLNDIIETEVGS